MALSNPSFYAVFLFSLLLFLTRKIATPVIRYLQVAIFMINAAIALIDGYDAFHGMGFLILSIVLAYRYGLLERHSRLKLGFMGLFTVFFLEYSIFRSGDDQVGSSVNILVYLIFFLTVIYMVYMDEINKILRIEKHFREKVVSMEEERARLLDDMDRHKAELHSMEGRMKELETQIEASRKPLDLKKHRITPREEDVIREFCGNPHLTTKEIAYNLHMSMGTVKQHFSNIFRKLKIRNRPELLDKCKWNYK